MLSSKAMQICTVFGLLFTRSHVAAYVYPRGRNASTPVTPLPTEAGTKTTTQPASITSCPVPLDTYLGTSLLSIYSAEGTGHFEQSFFSMYENWLTDDAYFQKVAAAPSLKFATDPAVVTKVYSYLTSLYTAISSETEYLWGPSYEAAAPFREIATDACLFTTCTNQYWSHKSASSTDGNLWFNQATSPCCGSCTVYAGGVQLFYWPTPNPTPSVTAYLLPDNYTLHSPTVLVYITDVWAADRCGDVGNSHAWGTGYFDPTWLSTSSIATEVHRWSELQQTWTPIDFADFGSQCTCTKKCKTDALLGPQTNLCTSQLEMPGGVRALDPAWATCGVAFQGVFDPPISLQERTGFFSPITTPVAEHTSPASSASPSPTFTSPGGPKTTPEPVTIPSSSTPTAPINGSPSPPNPGQGSPSPNSPPNQTQNQNPASPAPASPTPTAVVGGTTLSVNPSGFVVIAGTTLTPGGSAITVSGTVVSLAPGGTQVVIAGTTSQIGGAIITPGSGPLVSPSQIRPGSGAGRIGRGGVGMWSVLVGAVVGALVWL